MYLWGINCLDLVRGSGCGFDRQTGCHKKEMEDGNGD